MSGKKYFEEVLVGVNRIERIQHDSDGVKVILFSEGAIDCHLVGMIHSMRVDPTKKSVEEKGSD